MLDSPTSEGVRVRRPDPVDFSKPYSTPDWASPGGLYAAMPRDLMIVIGDQILETPLAWRSRFFEIHAYRSLLKEYFHRGGRWTAAPRPQLSDELYRHDRAAAEEEREFEVFDSVLTEFEPTFDAADFRNSVPRFAPENRKANQAVVELLGRIAEVKKATPAQVALAWLLARKPWIVPIPGTTKLHRLEENAAAAGVALTEDDLRDIEGPASEITVHGDRYPEAAQRMINR